MVETKRPANKPRRWKRFLIGALGVLLLLVVIYPLWLPWVIKPVAARLGVQFQDCQRHGYAAFEFSKVQWAGGSTLISAERVTLHTPHRFLWSRVTGAVGSDSQVRVEQWAVISQPVEEPADTGMASTGELLDAIQGSEPLLSKWVHSVVLTKGHIEMPGRSLAISSVILQDQQLTVDAFDSRAIIDLTSLASASVGLSVSNQHATAELHLKQEMADWDLEGDLFWQSNRFVLTGRFDRSDWLPATAAIGCDSLQVSSEQIGVDELDDLRGSARVAWTNNAYQFHLALSESAQPGAENGTHQVALSVNGTGDLAAVTVNQLELTSPLLGTSLERPLTLDYSGRVLQGSSTLRMWAELGRIEAVPLSGRLAGEIDLQPVVESLFKGRFRMRGTDVQGFGVVTETLELVGRLDWPEIEFETVNAKFAFGGLLSANLLLDANERRVQNLQWQLSGTELQSLPSDLQLQSLDARGSAEGIWPDLTHTGRVDVSGIQAGMFRADIGRAQWSGRAFSVDRFTASAESGSSTLALSGSAGALINDEGLRANIECHSLDLVAPEVAWRLKAPSRLTLLRQTNRFEASLSPLNVAGPAGHLGLEASVDWPARGDGQVSIKGLDSGQLDDFLAPALPRASVSEATTSFHWENGPLVFDSAVKVEWQETDQPLLTLAGRATSDGQSVQFDSVRLKIDGTPSAELTGTLPFRIEPSNGWRVVEPESGGEARFEARVFEKSPAWAWGEDYLGVKVDSPSLVIQASGSVPRVRGELTFAADRLTLPRSDTNATFVVPECEVLRVSATVGLDGVEVSQASAQLLGQGIEARARWKIDAADWKQWLAAVRKPDWQRITGSLLVENAQLSALSALVPGVVAPVGVVDLDLSLNPGLRMEGHLSITNGATRYLRPVGSLRDIRADIALSGWTGTINHFTATLGGQPVTLGGEVSWRADGDRRFDLQLSGENLSLVRDPDLFIRADVDLRLQKAFDDIARLFGDVNLQRSLLFQDFTMFVGGDLERPNQRPPYFSVPQPPFGDWQLDVRVKGDRFLNVISPAFKGEVSAGLHLLGTLREPLAVGTVSVDQGKILFPFGTLQIENGRIEFRREDPYRPRLDFRGQGENFGFSITVDLQGPMDAPNLIFQSVPPLTAQQILMMLSAGEIPRSDFGYSTTDKASKVGLYVGNQLVNRFFGNTSTTERLSLRSGEQITDDGRATYSIEYRLTDRWSVFGEYDRFQDVNSGVKFKVLSK